MTAHDQRPADMERDRYLDLLRVVAIDGVVYGHWLLRFRPWSGRRPWWRDRPMAVGDTGREGSFPPLAEAGRPKVPSAREDRPYPHHGPAAEHEP